MQVWERQNINFSHFFWDVHSNEKVQSIKLKYLFASSLNFHVLMSWFTALKSVLVETFFKFLFFGQWITPKNVSRQREFSNHNCTKAQKKKWTRSPSSELHQTHSPIENSKKASVSRFSKVNERNGWLTQGSKTNSPHSSLHLPFP